MKAQRTRWLDKDAFEQDKTWIETIDRRRDSQELVANPKLRELSEFFKWVECTTLFMSIKAHSGNPEWTVKVLIGEIDSITINLYGKKITMATELPKEVLEQFYLNSPWYKEQQDKPIQLNNQLNILLNESSDTSKR
jgi:hypothetical protein